MNARNCVASGENLDKIFFSYNNIHLSIFSSQITHLSWLEHWMA